MVWRFHSESGAKTRWIQLNAPFRVANLLQGEVVFGSMKQHNGNIAMPSTRIMRYAVVAVLVLLAGCATQPETDLDRYKVQFDYAASQLEVRKQETFQALQALEPLQ